MLKRTTAILVVALLAASHAHAQSKKFKPGMNFFSLEQDIQLGREASAEFEKQLPVVRNAEMDRMVERIATRLKKSPAAQANVFPYSFRVVNDKNINAFALPGGPMFLNTGLFLNADNEAQIAGVMAHEMSHVILRHGTNQMSKAQLMQGIGAGASIFLGATQGGLWGQLGQLGIGVGLQTVLLKYSRGAERDSDLLGAQIMNDAGYNPIEMARFFEKLEGQNGKDSKLAEFFASHPNPGNRVKAVEKEITTLPKRSFDAGNPQELARVKDIARGLPEPPKRPQGGGGNPNAPPSQSRPSSQLRNYDGKSYTFSYPDNWEAFPDQQGVGVTFAPRSGIIADQQGNVQIAYGTIIGFQATQGTDLERNAQAVLNEVMKGAPGAQVTAQPRRIEVNGVPAMLTTLQARSAFANEREALVVASLQARDGTLYVVFVAPESEYRQVEGVFQQMLRSLRFR
jgi:Zn-dependent protease with chaperone function